MPTKSWGTQHTIGEHLLVSDNTEIPPQQYAYVFNKQTTTESYVPKAAWESMINGDMRYIRDRIEQGISGVEVKWVMVAWEKAEVRPLTQYPYNNQVYCVSGFQTEALVFNKGTAALTGGEIVLILIAIAFLAAVIVTLSLGAWVVLQVMDAAAKLGPLATIGIGLLILVGVAFLLYLLLGGRAEHKGRIGKVKLGK